MSHLYSVVVPLFTLSGACLSTSTAPTNGANAVSMEAADGPSGPKFQIMSPVSCVAANDRSRPPTTTG